MSWLRLEGEDDVHIIPTHDEHPHIVSEACECTPELRTTTYDNEPLAKPHIVHRDELDRLEILER